MCVRVWVRVCVCVCVCVCVSLCLCVCVSVFSVVGRGGAQEVGGRVGGEGRGNRLFEFLLCLSSGGFRGKGLQRCRMSVLLWRSQGFVYEVYQYDVFVRFQGLELQRLQGFRFGAWCLQSPATSFRARKPSS